MLENIPQALPDHPIYKNRIWLLAVIFFASLVAIFDFSVMGVLQYQGDTPSYVDAINYLRNGSIPEKAEAEYFMKIRLMKPMYALVSNALPFKPDISVFVLNLFFYFLTAITFFMLLSKIGFGQRFSALGAIWFVTGYPVLKYGFALITDIGGYFFIVLSILVALKAIERREYIWFVLTGLICGFGALTKETGAFGMLFALGAIMMNFNKFGWKRAINSSLLVIILFCSVFVPVQALILLKMNSSLLNFWAYAQGDIERNLMTFMGIYGAAFNVLWIYAAVGIWIWFKTKKDWTWAALWLVGLPMLVWNSYVTRYAFTWFPAVIPFALLGLQKIYLNLKKYPKWQKPITASLAVLPILASVCLLLIARSNSIWNLLGIKI